MKQLYKIAFISLMAGFITAAVANDSDTPSVVERKTCSDIAAEITELSAIEEPDDETIELLESLKPVKKLPRGVFVHLPTKCKAPTEPLEKHEQQKKHLMKHPMKPLTKMVVCLGKP